MLYTVKEVSSLSNVTIKTLHHYHKIGLLLPREISEAGYRLYGQKELERLQQILFYRELEFPLEQIKQILDLEPDRMLVFRQQEELLLARQQRLDRIIQTLQHSISSIEKGEPMDNKEMFKGFNSEEEWKEVMEEQNEHLKETYNFDLLDSVQIDVQDMNDQAKEAAAFMDEMAKALKTGMKHSSTEVEQLIGDHLQYLNQHGHTISAEDFAAQTRFFLQDDFHLQMLESQQTGLAYYLSAAADSFAAG
ncbi:MerR family transcriptional regulator [Paenibacillus fonticola]|uniref:MerR family transcriptional regulator n=1 Tax=Paenibacillus fonticola TaxID=379896 RepID=UPI000371CE48|nr:MerR family transcriptional regulator [Paenibacillus fonticola]